MFCQEPSGIMNLRCIKAEYLLLYFLYGFKRIQLSQGTFIFVVYIEKSITSSVIHVYVDSKPLKVLFFHSFEIRLFFILKFGFYTIKSYEHLYS